MHMLLISAMRVSLLIGYAVEQYIKLTEWINLFVNVSPLIINFMREGIITIQKMFYRCYHMKVITFKL